MTDTKICRRCGRELPISEFNKNRNTKDGLVSYCKQCLKQYYAAKREDILEYKKQYYSEHRESMLEKQKQYNSAKREDILEYKKQYYDTLKGYCNTIRNNNILADRKQGRIGDELPSNYPTVEDYMELLQQVDFYDGKQYDFTEMGLDRINNSLPHTLDNVVSCTTKHNRERQKMSFDVFKAKFTE